MGMHNPNNLFITPIRPHLLHETAWGKIFQLKDGAIFVRSEHTKKINSSTQFEVDV